MFNGTLFFRHLLLLTIASCSVRAQDSTAVDRLLDRIVSQEHECVRQIQERTPLLETYIQETGDPLSGRIARDHYFLGRLKLGTGLGYTPIVSRSDAQRVSRLFVFHSHSVIFIPTGFAQMMFLDARSFSRANYKFEYVRREFLGDIRTIVFDLKPMDEGGAGRFIGRIWVEDRDAHIVRFNGTYTGSAASHLFFHFDSWRVNVSSSEWVPAMIYTEEQASAGKNAVPVSFKGQTRLWGYNSGQAAQVDELTNIAVELDSPVHDAEPSSETSPLESQRNWERQAEQNVIGRLEKSGVISPKGPVDGVLQGVVDNLIAGSGLDVEAHCRVVLTTPLETFTVGHTILISRGLIDVLPDEASLAMVLSDELAHIALGHQTNTQFAFHNRTMFSDDELFQRFQFGRSAEEIASAGKKGIEILGRSVYKDKLANAGLFLKALVSRADNFPNLIRANIGNQLADGATVVRMNVLAVQAPALEKEKLEQIAALPLGSRVKLDPWTDAVSLIKIKPVALLSAREKMFFEVTAFNPHLTRGDAPPVSQTAIDSSK